MFKPYEDQNGQSIIELQYQKIKESIYPVQSILFCSQTEIDTFNNVGKSLPGTVIDDFKFYKYGKLGCQDNDGP